MLDSLLERCGIIATYIGVLLEGEISLLTSVIASKMGLFNYSWALVAAFLGATTQGWFKYLVAKKHGLKLLNKKPKLKARVDKASIWFDKRPFLILVIHRFLFGMTTIILVLAGLKNMSYLKFAAASAIATLLWLSIFGGLGYFCAEAMIDTLHNISDYKWYLISSLAVLVIVVWFFKYRPFNRHCLDVIE